MIKRGPNDIGLGPSDKGWILHVSDVGFSDLLHFSDIGPSNKNWVK